MYKYFRQYIIIIILVFLMVLPYLVFASNKTLDELKAVGSGDTGPYLPTTDQTTLAKILGVVVSAFLGLLGVIFIVLTIYAGYNWMTAQGEEEKVKKAKDTLRQSIIGLVIVIGAYAIWAFIRYRLISF